MADLSDFLSDDDSGPLTPESYQKAVDQERLHNARILNQLRLAGGLLFAGVLLVFGRKLPAGGNGELVLVLSYAAVALLLCFFSRNRPRLCLAGGMVVPFLDMPVAAWAQAMGMASTDSQLAVAHFTGGILLCMVLLAAMSLRQWQIYTAAVLGLALEWRLQALADDSPRGFAGTLVLFAAVAAVCLAARKRRVSLAASVCHEQLKRERLGRYFSPQVSAAILEHGDVLKVGLSFEVTVLFADLRGFTSMSETISSEAAVAILNEFLEEMVTAVFEHGGTLDKYLGDGLLAYFGAPLTEPAHADRALSCAVAMKDRMERLNLRRVKRGEPSLQIGIGLHSGLATVGSIGAPHRREYTVVGDTVNLASRIESLTKDYGETIVLTHATVERILPARGFVFRVIGPVPVRGKAQPVVAYALLGKEGKTGNTPAVAS